MKNRILLSFLFIFLILALMDCGMIPPGIPEWMRAEESICQYWMAIINHQYKLAEYYYVLWEEYINTNSEGEVLVLIYLPSFYKPAEVIGYNTIVHTRITVDKIPFLGSCIIVWSRCLT